MNWNTPLGTVWPAMVALLVWVWAIRGIRREIRLPPGWWILGIVVLAVRLFWVPSMEFHTFDGHEAEYWDLFRGFREPSRGGTVMVPAMQWFWWLAGLVLPESHQLVIFLSSMIGLLSVAFFAGAMGHLLGARTGWLTGVLLALHPAHAAWSSSAYNVILPHLFGCLAIYAASVTARRVSPPGAWGWVAASSLALSAALRLDSGSIAVVVVGMVLLVRPNGMSVWDRIRQWSPAGAGCLAMTGLCAWPLIWPGQLPGSGERSLSFGINIGFLDVYHPFDSVLGLGLLLVAVIIGLVRRYPQALPLVMVIVLHHLMMSTFDDFGERHAMVVVPALVGLVVIGMGALGTLGWLGIVLCVGLEVMDLQDLRHRFYGSEPQYTAVIDGPEWQDLPRKEWTPELPGECGWVAEDARVARKPPTSHFNILNPVEEQSLRSSDGCLLWCVDVQDWRWSSRGVRDRALRLAHLFPLKPAFVVTDSSTGYGCLVMEVGPRHHPMTETLDGNDTAASRGDQSIP